MSQGKRMTREEAVLKGADKKNPQRYRTEIPKSSFELGEAPDHMSAAAKACWFEIAAFALPGVMTGAERLTMEIVSNLTSEYRKDPAEFAPAKLALLIRGLGSLGMNPMDRQRLGIAKTTKPPKKEDGFADF